MWKKFILIFIVLTSAIFCDSNSSKYLFNDGYGYISISKETVNFLIDKMHFPVRIQSPERYDYIYQKYPFDTLMAFPYIRVQINERGRLSKAELLEFKKDHYKYNPETHYLWQENSFQLNVIIPTQLGTINIFCYSSDNKFASDKESFYKIINSIVLATDLKYKPSFVRDIPFLNNLIFGGGGVIYMVLIVIIGVTISIRRKMKSFNS